MAQEPVKSKKVRKPKKQKVRQGHKLVWLTLIIILVPCLIVGYVLLTSAKGTDKPVEGSRFSASDLNPKIQENQISAIQGELMNIPGIESATINLKSATLRVHLNMTDGMSDEELNNAAEQAYGIVAAYLPIETYFTNTADGKNYDLQIDAYNYLIDEAHPAEGQRFIQITKTSAGNKVTDNLTVARNPELSESVRYTPPAVPEADPAPENPEG